MEERATRGGLDEADEVPPAEAVAHDGKGSLSYRRPDPAQEQLEPDAMLVERGGGPELDRRLRVRAGYGADERADLLRKVRREAWERVAQATAGAKVTA